MSSKSAESNRKLYAFYKAHGICVKCGQADAAPGKTMCFDCLEKTAENSRRYRTEQTEEQRTHNQEKHRQYIKRMRADRKAEGKCIYCGKPLDPHSKCFCTECRIKNQRKNDRRKDGIARSERPAYGLCYRCGKPIESGTLCEDCLRISRNNLPDKMNDDLYRYHKEQNNLIFGNSL